MEENGYFKKHPDALESAKIKADEAKHMVSNPVDYQKVGHPLERTD
jgi:hypothetical protein